MDDDDDENFISLIELDLFELKNKIEFELNQIKLTE